ncbi:hypothetical protein U9M48_023860 [Paspalum notatum var. saurae]|uniref:Uncharacterized protein n=1 Tax=Paspalum notatum var. saurae TaxID=547442 RepID=A0AAQ3TPL0_PASNO
MPPLCLDPRWLPLPCCFSQHCPDTPLRQKQLVEIRACGHTPLRLHPSPPPETGSRLHKSALTEVAHTLGQAPPLVPQWHLRRHIGFGLKARHAY